MEEFADDNFEFYENGRKFSKQVENTVGKGEIVHYEQFLLFPQCFQDLYCRHVKTSACLGKGSRWISILPTRTWFEGTYLNCLANIILAIINNIAFSEEKSQNANLRVLFVVFWVTPWTLTYHMKLIIWWEQYYCKCLYIVYALTMVLLLPIKLYSMHKMRQQATIQVFSPAPMKNVTKYWVEDIKGKSAPSDQQCPFPTEASEPGSGKRGLNTSLLYIIPGETLSDHVSIKLVCQ